MKGLIGAEATFMALKKSVVHGYMPRDRIDAKIYKDEISAVNLHKTQIELPNGKWQRFGSALAERSFSGIASLHVRASVAVSNSKNSRHLCLDEKEDIFLTKGGNIVKFKTVKETEDFSKYGNYHKEESVFEIRIDLTSERKADELGLGFWNFGIPLVKTSSVTVLINCGYQYDVISVDEIKKAVSEEIVSTDNVNCKCALKEVEQKEWPKSKEDVAMEHDARDYREALKNAKHYRVPGISAQERNFINGISNYAKVEVKKREKKPNILTIADPHPYLMGAANFLKQTD